MRFYIILFGEQFFCDAGTGLRLRHVAFAGVSQVLSLFSFSATLKFGDSDASYTSTTELRRRGSRSNRDRSDDCGRAAPQAAAAPLRPGPGRAGHVSRCQGPSCDGSYAGTTSVRHSDSLNISLPTERPRGETRSIHC